MVGCYLVEIVNSQLFLCYVNGNWGSENIFNESFMYRGILKSVVVQMIQMEVEIMCFGKLKIGFGGDKNIISCEELCDFFRFYDIRVKKISV